jgi:hypothetical protein
MIDTIESNDGMLLDKTRYNSGSRNSGGRIQNNLRIRFQIALLPRAC